MTTRWRDKILFPVSRDFVSLYLRSGLEFPILDNLKHEAKGEVFAVAVMALTGENKNRISQVYTVVADKPELVSGLVSALGWVKSSDLQGIASGLLSSEIALWRRLGMAACAVHRVDPGKYLLAALADKDDQLRARAARTSGELGRTDLKKPLTELLTDASEEVRFWSAWSAVLLGDRSSGLKYFLGLMSADNIFRGKALQLGLRVMDAESSKRLLKPLSEQPATLRLALQGVGVVGDPVYIPWLIKHFDEPEYARVAGESFSMITELDLAYDDLETEGPADFEAGPTEDPADNNVDLDDDEDLPWPSRELIQAWWTQNSSSYQVGQRYFMGAIISEPHCQSVLKTGQQRQRAAAALELALMKPDALLFNVAANGRYQKKLLDI